MNKFYRDSTHRLELVKDTLKWSTNKKEPMIGDTPCIRVVCSMSRAPDPTTLLTGTKRSQKDGRGSQETQEPIRRGSTVGGSAECSVLGKCYTQPFIRLRDAGVSVELAPGGKFSLQEPSGWISCVPDLGQIRFIVNDEGFHVCDV